MSNVERLGPYEVRGILGRGGMGIVYRAYEAALDREVAIKVLLTRTDDNPSSRERFRREAMAIARLRHPNILQVYTLGEADGAPYLVMELIAGGALTHHLDRPLPLADAARIIRQIGAALDHAHAQGLVHRDVKPANIFTDGPRAVLADFGIVKLLAEVEGTRLTLTDSSIGTPEYIAPEQVSGGAIDGRADLYSLGIVLYELLTGRTPYKGLGSPYTVMYKHVAGPLPDPRTFRADLPAPICAVIVKALARDPDDRYQTGQAFADALDGALAASSASETRVLPRPVSPAMPVPPPSQPLPLHAGTPNPPTDMPTGVLPARAPAQPAGRGVQIALIGALALLIGLVGVGIALRGRGTGATATATTRSVAGASPSATTAFAPASLGTARPPAASSLAPPPAAVISPTAPAARGSATVGGELATQLAAGDAALQDGRFQEARDRYAQAARVDARSAVAQRQLGLTRWLWKHESGEYENLQAATKLDEGDALAWAYRSFSALDTHQKREALEAANRARQADPQSPEAYAALANYYISAPVNTANPAANRDAAREALDQAKRLGPRNMWVLWVEHKVLVSQDRGDESVLILDQLLALRPGWATFYAQKGAALRAVGRYPEAREAQAAARLRDPEHPLVLTELGWLAYQARNYADATTLFRNALRTTGEVNNSAYVGLGLALTKQADATTGLAQCRRATSIEPDDAEAHACLGQLNLEDMKEYAQAQASYQRALELRPDWEVGAIGLARVYGERDGDYARAERTLRQYLPQVKRQRLIQTWLGWAILQQGRVGEALIPLETGTQNAADEPVSHFWYAKALEKAGRIAEARAAYQRALAIDPGYDEAKQALDQLPR